MSKMTPKEKLTNYTNLVQICPNCGYSRRIGETKLESKGLGSENREDIS